MTSRRLIHEAFHEAVRTHSARPALESGDASLTYARLQALSRGLASRLDRLGFGAGSRIGVIADRSPATVIAMLGVLEAGGAYVPLAHEGSVERLKTMVSSARIVAIVGDSASSPIARDLGLPIVAVDIHAIPDIQRPLPVVQPDSVAYVMFTSGTTGEPKGVVVEHGSVASYLATIRGCFDLSAADRVAQVASFAFDASVEELFGGLGVGATVCLWQPDPGWTLTSLLRWVEANRITVLNLPTAVWHTLLLRRRQVKFDLPKSVRLVVLGGELLRADLMAEWLANSRSPARIVDMYGPTEATISVCMADVRVDWDWGGDAPVQTLGRLLPGVAGSVRRDDGSVADVREPGELWLSGAALAQGYVNGDLGDGFIDVDGERTYMTGDVVARRHDGRLVFLGRLDDQVQVNGVRTHLGAVESALVGIAPIVEAAVLVDARDRTRLVAFVRVAGSSVLPPAELRRCLLETLPPVMVPGQIVTVERFEYLPSGKIDRKELSKRLVERLDGSCMSADLDGVRRRMALLLQLADVAPDDDFFQLGGDSLLTAELLAGVQDDFGLEVTFPEFHADPTPRGLAAHIATLQA